MAAASYGRRLRHGARWWVHLSFWSLWAIFEWLDVGGSLWEDWYFDAITGLPFALGAAAMLYATARHAAWVSDEGLTLRRFRGRQHIAWEDVRAVWTGRIPTEWVVETPAGLQVLPTAWLAIADRQSLVMQCNAATNGTPVPTVALRPRSLIHQTAWMVFLLLLAGQLSQVVSWRTFDGYSITDLALAAVFSSIALLRSHASAHLHHDALVIRRSGFRRIIRLDDIDHVEAKESPGAPFVYLYWPAWIIPGVAALVLTLWRPPGVAIETAGRRIFVPAVAAPAGTTASFTDTLRGRAGLEAQPPDAGSGHVAPGLRPFPPIHAKGRRLALALALVYILASAVVTTSTYVQDGPYAGYGLALTLFVILTFVIILIDLGAPRGVPGGLRVAGRGLIPYPDVQDVMLATRFRQPVIKIHVRGRTTPVFIPYLRRDAAAMSKLFERLHGVAEQNTTHTAPAHATAPPTLRMKGLVRGWFVLVLLPALGLAALGIWGGVQGDATGWVLAFAVLVMSSPLVYIVVRDPKEWHGHREVLRVGRTDIAFADVSAVWVTPSWLQRKIVVQSIRHPAPFAIDTSIRRTGDADRLAAALVSAARDNAARGIDPPIVRASALSSWFTWGAPSAMAALMAIAFALLFDESSTMMRWTASGAAALAGGIIFLAVIARLGCGVGPTTVVYRDRLGRWQRIPVNEIRRVVPPKMPSPASHPDVYAHHPRIGVAGKRPPAGSIVLELDDGRRVTIRPAPDLAANAPVLALAIASSVEHARDRAAAPKTVGG